MRSSEGRRNKSVHNTAGSGSSLTATMREVLGLSRTRTVVSERLGLGHCVKSVVLEPQSAHTLSEDYRELPSRGTLFGDGIRERVSEAVADEVYRVVLDFSSVRSFVDVCEPFFCFNDGFLIRS